ncbi:MAG TPA: hypothetical protein VH137_05790, partial [Gemmatimonadales bacterium]|nr:hypothetical protein [Gemmatimonadales bacterium]
IGATAEPAQGRSGGHGGAHAGEVGETPPGAGVELQEEVLHRSTALAKTVRVPPGFPLGARLAVFP